MSDNLTVFGTNYTNVTGIKAKGTGNGILTYIRPIGTLSIAENGTYDVAAYADVDVNVSGGGGGDSGGNMSDPIRFFDYDGTLVASYSAVPESLPSVPTHDKLTNGTWNYTLAQVATQFNAMGTCDVGANYDTVSGATEIDIVLQEGRLHPYLSLAIDGTVTIDWGDNSTSTATGTSLTTRLSTIHHEYAAAGSYTIKITKTSGTGYSLYGTSGYPLLNNNSSTSAANRVYANCVQAVRIGEDCGIGNYAFNVCYSLVSVSIPSGVTSIGNSAFSNCVSLVFVSIPSGVTSFGSSVIYACYSLVSVSIPSGVTSISASAFASCYGMAEYHFEPTTPPTLANTNAFTNIQSDCVIYVPAASLTAYQEAENWSTYASYMVGE